MNESIAVAMSGGIDSLVTAHLLTQEGHRVFGIHFLTGYEPPATPGGQGKNLPDPLTAAKGRLSGMVEQLDIPLHVVDASAIFKKEVVAYFTRTYLAGRTPNPCMACNPAVKFGFVFQHASRLGAAAMATGHYARIEHRHGNRHRLYKGRDSRKDQSYFLARMTQEQLGRTRFPLGSWTKAEVRQYATEKRLVPSMSDESQDVCFIRDKSYTRFLAEIAGVEPEPGPIEDTIGNIIGRHQGLFQYTVGQRRGINCPGPEPYYVVRLDTARNTLVVGGKDDILTSVCTAGEINWIALPPSKPLAVAVRIRYRHEPVDATVIPLDDRTATIAFENPQPAVTPGQGAVFYRDNEVLGGGWIRTQE